MAGARVRVVNRVTLTDRPVGERGEVLVAGSRIMKGYWRKPGQTAQVMLPGGWLRTGDGGSFDADGFLYLHDRLRDMIISGGENVYPAEIESVMTGHPAVEVGVAEVAIVGVSSGEWGESPYAVVVLCPGARVTEDDLIRWIRDRLAHFKCPPGHVRPLPGPNRLRQAAEAGDPVRPGLPLRPVATTRPATGCIARSATLYASSVPAASQRSAAWPSRGFSSVGRALAWHARGQGFESPKLHVFSCTRRI